VAQKMWISTFHSACVRILRREVLHLRPGRCGPPHGICHP
jgi:superfamily I DNA/RNA helicase